MQMKIKGKVEVEQVVGHRCDICGADCREDVSGHGDTNDIHATLFAHWPYGSKHDLLEHTCHMCESCYDKVKNFITHELGGVVHKKPYPPFGD